MASAFFFLVSVIIAGGGVDFDAAFVVFDGHGSEPCVVVEEGECVAGVAEVPLLFFVVRVVVGRDDEDGRGVVAQGESEFLGVDDVGGQRVDAGADELLFFGVDLLGGLEVGVSDVLRDVGAGHGVDGRLDPVVGGDFLRWFWFVLHGGLEVGLA